jgi:FixJ family two-component response regulator
VGIAEQPARRRISIHASGNRQEKVMSEALPTVIVIDDDPDVRGALQNLLRSVGLQVDALASPEQFFDRKPPAGPCCLVLDVRLPGKSGLDFQEELQKAKNRLPIIFITGHGDVRMSVRAMKAGAHEFLPKPFHDQDLLDAVQSALEHDRMRLEHERSIRSLRRQYESLTAREREVMALVAGGAPNKKIAAQLGLSEITVKAHRGRVMRKMKFQSLADLVRTADKLHALRTIT